MRKYSGFTLVELLVVIAIMALLVSFLLPALGKAKEHAQSVICLANMKALVVAWINYADENDDRLVYGSTYTNPTNPPWATTRSYNASNPPTVEERQQDIMDGSLWPYVQSIEAYKCPSAPLGYLRNYSIQDCLNGEGTWWLPGGDPGAERHMVRKISNIKQPSDIFVFMGENDPRGYNYGTWVTYTNDANKSKWCDPVTIWHRDSTNFAFADGSSRPQRWVDERTIEIAENGTIYANTPDNPDLTWLKFGYKAKK